MPNYLQNIQPQWWAYRETINSKVSWHLQENSVILLNFSDTQRTYLSCQWWLKQGQLSWTSVPPLQPWLERLWFSVMEPNTWQNTISHCQLHIFWRLSYLLLSTSTSLRHWNATDLQLFYWPTSCNWGATMRQLTRDWKLLHGQANISPRIYEHCKIQQHETHLASPIRSKGSPATTSCSVRLQTRTQSNCIKIHQEYQCLIQRAYQAIYTTRLSSITYPDTRSSSQGIQASEIPVLPGVQFSKKFYLWGLVDNKLESGRSPWVRFNWQHYNPTVTHTTQRCHLVYVHHLKTDRWQKSLQKLVICTWATATITRKEQTLEIHPLLTSFLSPIEVQMLPKTQIQKVPAPYHKKSRCDPAQPNWITTLLSCLRCFLHFANAYRCVFSEAEGIDLKKKDWCVYMKKSTNISSSQWWIAI